MLCIALLCLCKAWLIWLQPRLSSHEMLFIASCGKNQSVERPSRNVDKCWGTSREQSLSAPGTYTEPENAGSVTNGDIELSMLKYVEILEIN